MLTPNLRKTSRARTSRQRGDTLLNMEAIKDAFANCKAQDRAALITAVSETSPILHLDGLAMLSSSFWLRRVVIRPMRRTKHGSH
jgi:hypothetical protein